MTGSLATPPAFSPIVDSTMATRLETIKQLAGELSSMQVAVMDRNFNVLYANQMDGSTNREGVDVAQQPKCYEVFAHQTGSCENCPAIKLFEARDVQCLSSTSEQGGAPCGMQRAYPLAAGNGQVAAMMALFDSFPSGRIRSESRMQDDCPSAIERERSGDLIGKSSVMQALFDMIALVAESHAPVLIQGESGTGKELVAKTIHRHGNRRHRPFVVVDCGSLPETLLESELFGHMKGSFTGAITNKRGLFQEADGGTIFLDEIADTVPAFQAKLLRVLQEGEIKPVGGNQRIKVDVRVISATNKDLSELVKAKQFRQDLYYRLAVLPLHLPPLRDRREDIPLLVDHFVKVSCVRHRQAARQVSPDVMQAFTEAVWPGNVRELQHYIERTVVTTGGPLLPYAETAVKLSDQETEDLRSVARHAARQVERMRILQALSRTSGNRVRAAKALRISRASLYNKLREHAIG